MSTWAKSWIPPRGRALALLGLCACGSAEAAATPRDGEPAGDGATAAGDAALPAAPDDAASTPPVARDGGAPEPTCASADALAIPKRPRLWWVLPTAGLVVNAGWADATYGEVLERLFLGNDGLLTRFQHRLDLGVVFAANGTPDCAAWVDIPPGPDTLPHIDTAFRAHGLGASLLPWTVSALRHLTDQHLATASRDVPTYVVWQVAETNRSGCDLPATGAFTPLEEVRRIEDAPLYAEARRAMEHADKLFVLADGLWLDQDPARGAAAVARDDQLAAIGHTGHAYGYGHGLLSYDGLSTLRDDLGAVLADLVQCTVELDGHVVPGEECRGTLQLDGAPLPCNDPDGWSMKGARTVELHGAACARYKAATIGRVQARFPCGVLLR